MAAWVHDRVQAQLGWCLSAPCTLVHCDYVCCVVDGVCEGDVRAEECPARQALGAQHAEADVCMRLVSGSC